jgi:hypothetical protein
MTKLGTNEKGEGVGALGIILLIVLVIAIGVAGFFSYRYFHKSSGIVSSNVPTHTINASSTGTSSTSSTAKNQSSTSATSTPTESTAGTSTVKLADLGVEITVPNSIDDLIHLDSTTSTTPAAKTSVLSTTTLSNLDPACGIDSTKTTATIQGIGELYEYNGKFTTSTNPDKTSVWSKQFPTFYVAYNTPASNCSKTATTNAKAQTQITDLKSALASMTVTSS